MSTTGPNAGRNAWRRRKRAERERLDEVTRDRSVKQVAALIGLREALEPLRQDIVDAAETDTQWEAVARAAGWLT